MFEREYLYCWLLYKLQLYYDTVLYRVYLLTSTPRPYTPPSAHRSLSCLHNKNLYLSQKTPSSVSNCEHFNQTSEYQKYYKCYICFAIILMQNYSNWVLRVTWSLLLVSDGAHISGAVSAVHCYRKHLSDSNLLLRIKIYQILCEENFINIIFLYFALSKISAINSAVAVFISVILSYFRCTRKIRHIGKQTVHISCF